MSWKCKRCGVEEYSIEYPSDNCHANQDWCYVQTRGDWGWGSDDIREHLWEQYQTPEELVAEQERRAKEANQQAEERQRQEEESKRQKYTTKEGCLAEIRQGNGKIDYVPKAFWLSSEFCLSAVENDSNALQYVPLTLWQNTDFCLAVVQKNYAALDYVPDLTPETSAAAEQAKKNKEDAARKAQEERERLERERLAKEKAEREERERLERERLAKEKAEREAREAKAAKEKAEQEEREKLERERLAKEKTKQEIKESLETIREILEEEVTRPEREAKEKAKQAEFEERNRREEEHRQQRMQWASQGLCIYCGGKLSGIFTKEKKCKSCGKENSANINAQKKEVEGERTWRGHEPLSDMLKNQIQSKFSKVQDPRFTDRMIGSHNRAEAKEFYGEKGMAKRAAAEKGISLVEYCRMEEQRLLEELHRLEE